MAGKKSVTHSMSNNVTRVFVVAATLSCSMTAPIRAAEVPIGYAAKTLVSPFEVLVQDQVIVAAKQAGFKVLAPTNADQDAGKQIADMQTLIGAGAKGIIVPPVDGKAIIPALDYAAARGIPVVAIDEGPGGGKVYAIVRADNVGMGKMACEAMAKGIGGKGKVLSLQGGLTSINARERSQGFRDCVKGYPGMELIERPTDWDAAKAASILQTVLGGNPDLKGVYEQSDWALPGTLNVLKQARRNAKAGELEHIYHISIDATPLGLQMVRNGDLDAAISQPLDAYAKYGVQYLQDALSGKELPLGKTDHGSEVVDYNGNRMDLLQAVLVTKDNVDDKSLWGNQAQQK